MPIRAEMKGRYQADWALSMPKWLESPDGRLSTLIEWKPEAIGGQAICATIRVLVQLPKRGDG